MRDYHQEERVMGSAAIIRDWPGVGGRRWAHDTLRYFVLNTRWQDTPGRGTARQGNVRGVVQRLDQSQRGKER